MSNVIKVTVENSEKISKAFKEMGRTVEKNMMLEIEASINEISTQAQTEAPVRFGILKSSIYTRMGENYGEVRVGVHYAPYMEFGTGGEVDVPAGMEQYALEFKADPAKRQVNIPPHPFLMPAFFNESQLLQERLDKQIKILINS